jgi:hypothetical protein
MAPVNARIWLAGTVGARRERERGKEGRMEGGGF